MNKAGPERTTPPQSHPVDSRPASASPLSTLNPQPPQVPDHELLRCIGRGSYGEVWLARSALGTLRAVKVVHRASFDHDQPFEREFKGIQKFEPVSRSHEGLVDVLQVGRNEAAGCFYYVMELADDAVGTRSTASDSAEKIRDGVESVPAKSKPGTDQSLLTSAATYSPKTLRSHLRSRTRLPVSECIEIGLALADALAHLHQSGLVHRDIKPSNIIFVGGKPKLADIGLVADISEARSFVGTTGFIPPEGPGKAQADLYSLGKVLYEISTGHDRLDFPALPPNLRELPDAGALIEFNEIVVKACAADPAQRYSSAANLRTDLELLQRGRSVKQRRLSQSRLRALRRVGLAAAAVIVIVVGVMTLLRMGERFRAQAVTLLNDDRTSGTKNLRAAEAYRIGVPALRRGSTEGFRQALESFTAATDADSSFVAAQARLFETYLMSEDHGIAFIDRKAERLNALAEKMVKLAPTNTDTHAAVAIIRFVNEWKWTEAEAEFRQALKADPNCRMALTYYGYFLTRLGRAGEAREVLNRARQLNPDSPLIMKFLGHCEFFTRDYDKALQLYLKTSDLEPSYPSGHYWAGRAYLAMTNQLQALEEFRQFELKQDRHQSWAPWRKKGLRAVLEKEGPRGLWTKLLEMEASDAGDKEARPPYFCAECYARLGDADQAFEWLEKACDRRSGGEHLLFDEFWNRFRHEPRFKEIVKKVGLEQWAR